MIKHLEIGVDTEIPPEWLETSMLRHINDPYSDAALAEVAKGSIDVGAVDVSDQGTYAERTLKAYASEPNFLDDSEGLVRAHELFLGAVRTILGPSQYRRTTVLFTQRRGIVPAGKQQASGPPHLDSYKDSDYSYDCLRIVGIACKGLPTTLLHGGLTSEDLTEEGDLIDATQLQRFTAEPVKESRLTLLAPAQLHNSPYANQLTEDRLFLRWHART